MVVLLRKFDEWIVVGGPCRTRVNWGSARNIVLGDVRLSAQNGHPQSTKMGGSLPHISYPN